MRVLLAVLLASLVGCTSDPVNTTEVLRVPNPSGTLEAVVVEKVGGGIRECDYDVYVQKPGETVISEQTVARLVASHSNQISYGVNVRWSTPTILQIRYFAAKDATLLQSQSGEVEVQLVDRICDPTAPFANMAASREPEPESSRLLEELCEKCSDCTLERQEWPLVYVHLSPPR